MFTDEELELIESILTEHGEAWVQEMKELRLLNRILEKIDKQLNG